MFAVLLTSLTNIVIGSMPAQMARPSATWEIDKNQVFVGGCVTIVFDGTSRELAGLMLRIGDRPALDILEAWPTIRSRGKTYVLISHDLLNSEGLQRIEGTDDGVRMVPLFHSPGTVRLTLMLANEIIATSDIEVVEPPEGSGAAIDLMFPRLERKRHNKAPRALLFRLLMGADVSHMVKDSNDAIELLHEELLIVTTHPDWTDIAAMTVADAEAKVHYKSTIRACREARDEGRELNTEPPISALISNALARDLNSSYAEAIRDRIRKTIAAREWIPSLIEIPTPTRP